MKKPLSFIISGLILLSGCSSETNASPVIEVTDTEPAVITEISESTPVTANEVTMMNTSAMAEPTSINTTTTQTATTPKVTESMETTAVKTTNETTQSPKQTNTEKTTLKQTTAKTIETSVSESISVSEEQSDMPDIVFILTFEYDSVGHFVTKDGKIKSFNFNETNSDGEHYIGDLRNYNMLPEISADTVYPAISNEELKNLYEVLLDVSEEYTFSILRGQDNDELVGQEYYGNYCVYGVKFNIENELKIIPLGYYGDTIFISSDPIANELLEKLKLIIPDPYYLY